MQHAAGTTRTPAGRRAAAGAPPATRGGLQTLAVLQRTAGNAAVVAHVQRGPGTKAPPKPPPKPAPKDKAFDVVEAVVHVLSPLLSLTGDWGPGGEKLWSPLHATEVARTVLQQEHRKLLMIWHLFAVADEVTSGDRSGIESQHRTTAALFAAAKKDKKVAAKVAPIEARYDKALEILRQRAAREQVDEMTDAGVAAAAGKKPVPGSAEERVRMGAVEASKVLADVGSLHRKLASLYTTAKHTDNNNARARLRQGYDEQLRTYLRKVFKDGEMADAPELRTVARASGMNLADGIHLLKGGLDAVSAIMAVTDPAARAELFKSKETYFGNVAKGADMNALLWKFVSGTIALGGAGVYGMAKLAGNVALAESVLDATVKGVAHIGAPLNLAGLVHGAAVLLDPDATPDQKAAAAVEATSSAVGLAGYAARWSPRLAVFAKWSGPIAMSLAINFQQFKYLAGLKHKAQVGLNRLDWVSCHKATKAAAIEVQTWQRRLAVTTAMRAVDTDPRRQAELKKNADVYRMELIDGHLKPFVAARLASKGMDDDAASCGKALSRRFRPVQAMLASGAATDEAALGAGAAFLQTVEQAFAEWDHIVMEKNP